VIKKTKNKTTNHLVTLLVSPQNIPLTVLGNYQKKVASDGLRETFPYCIFINTTCHKEWYASRAQT